MEKQIKSDLKKQFQMLKLKNCKNLYVTSNLRQFSKVRIRKNKKLEVILSALIKTMGKNFTIFTPAASLNLCNTNQVFDPVKTPSHKMGPLSEYIRLKKSVRSIHPFWSIAGIGKNSKLLKNVSRHAYGYGSPWSTMLNLDFTQLNIGTHPSRAVTLVHHIETIMGVPYRFNKEFKQKILINKKIQKKTFYLSTMFKTTKIQKRKKLNEHFFKVLKDSGKLNYFKNSFGLEMWSFKMRDFFDVVTKMMRDDIYCYLEKKPNLAKVHKN